MTSEETNPTPEGLQYQVKDEVADQIRHLNKGMFGKPQFWLVLIIVAVIVYIIIHYRNRQQKKKANQLRDIETGNTEHDQNNNNNNSTTGEQEPLNQLTQPEHDDNEETENVEEKPTS